jgi:uncharacterized repeat protein (TIGR04138 family)
MPEIDLYEKLADLAEESGTYHANAFIFVLSAIERTRATLKRQGHIKGGELCEAARDLAIREYGPAAKMVLNGWGIESTLDIGKIVFLMVDEGLLSKTEDDSLDDFRDGFDFETEFVEKYRF